MRYGARSSIICCRLSPRVRRARSRDVRLERVECFWRDAPLAPVVRDAEPEELALIWARHRALRLIDLQPELLGQEPAHRDHHPIAGAAAANVDVAVVAGAVALFAMRRADQPALVVGCIGTGSWPSAAPAGAARVLGDVTGHVSSMLSPKVAFRSNGGRAAGLPISRRMPPFRARMSAPRRRRDVPVRGAAALTRDQPSWPHQLVLARSGGMVSASFAPGGDGVGLPQ